MEVAVWPGSGGAGKEMELMGGARMSTRESD
jgi:hypothetical protein